MGPGRTLGIERYINCFPQGSKNPRARGISTAGSNASAQSPVADFYLAVQHEIH
jgi:hypothetical protein